MPSQCTSSRLSRTTPYPGVSILMSSKHSCRMTTFRLIIYEDVMFYQLPLEWGCGTGGFTPHGSKIFLWQYIFNCAAFMQFGYYFKKKMAIRYSNVLRVSPWAFQSMATMHSCNLVCWLLISPNPFRVIHEFNKELTPYNRYLDSKVAFANYLWPYLVNQEKVSHCEKRSSAPWTEETLRIGEIKGYLRCYWNCTKHINNYLESRSFFAPS